MNVECRWRILIAGAEERVLQLKEMMKAQQLQLLAGVGGSLPSVAIAHNLATSHSAIYRSMHSVLAQPPKLPQVAATTVAPAQAASTVVPAQAATTMVPAQPKKPEEQLTKQELQIVQVMNASVQAPWERCLHPSANKTHFYLKYVVRTLLESPPN